MAKATMSNSTPPSKSSKAPAKTAGPAKGVKAAVTNPGGSRIPRFLHEVRIEMGKVTWPSRPELIQSTIVVMVAVAVAAAYIGLLDLVWSSLVNFFALR
jgi:preprotein translocase subunit SecE